MIYIENLSIFQVFVFEVDFACMLNLGQNGTGAIYISLNT